MVATKRPSRCICTPLAAISPVSEAMTDISCVPGSIARTQIPSAVLCIPRNENGSPWVAETIASTSGSRGRSTLGSLHFGQDAKDAVQRNVDPAGTVRQFVRNFVNSLFQYEERQHVSRLYFARGIGCATAHRLTVSGAEPVHRPLPPCFGELRHPRRRGGPGVGELPDGGITGVIKGPDHSRDVAERRPLAPAFGERPGRLALEVDDEKVVLNDDHLAEMEISMIPGLLGLDLVRHQDADQPEETVALRDKTVRELLGRDRQCGAPTLEFGQHIRNGGLEIAPPSRHIRPGYRFRCKIGIVAPL